MPLAPMRQLPRIHRPQRNRQPCRVTERPFIFPVNRRIAQLQNQFRPIPRKIIAPAGPDRLNLSKIRFHSSKIREVSGTYNQIQTQPAPPKIIIRIEMKRRGGTLRFAVFALIL
jgi:hypothetical protein